MEINLFHANRFWFHRFICLDGGGSVALLHDTCPSRRTTSNGKGTSHLIKPSLFVVLFSVYFAMSKFTRRHTSVDSAKLKRAQRVRVGRRLCPAHSLVLDIYIGAPTKFGLGVTLGAARSRSLNGSRGGSFRCEGGLRP